MAKSAPAQSPPAATDEPKLEVTAAAATKPEKLSTDDLTQRERIVLFTAGGPLLVDAWVTMEGRPHNQIFSERVQKVLDAADTNKDRKSTWRELATNEEFLKAERALNPNYAEGRAKAWLERYDLNRDKHIQPGEAAAWLGRDAGLSAAPLALRSRRSYHAIPALSSRVWQLIDTDNNRRLSAAEMDATPDKFLSLDANDDRIITTAELAPLREQLLEAGRQVPTAGSYETRYAALELASREDVDQLEYLLADLYSPRRALGPGSFPALPRLFDQLDASGDHQLNQDELAGLLTLAPHLQLAIAFDRPGAGKPGKARIDVPKHDSEIEVLAQPAESRLALSLGNIRINVSANDLAMVQPAEAPDGYAASESGEVRAMVHDECDALFEALDRNADGRLGEREIATAPARMRQLDMNSDGQLANEELPTAMIVAFMRSERPDDQSFYVPETPATPRTKGDAPAWFANADFNGDSDISRREFLGSLEQFHRLDANGDSFISIDEAVAAMPAEPTRVPGVEAEPSPQNTSKLGAH